jgi:hypothetical protein
VLLLSEDSSVNMEIGLWAPSNHQAQTMEAAAGVRTLDAAGKQPLWGQRRMWEANVKVDFKEILCEDGRWTEVALDRVQWRGVVLTLPYLQFY